MANRFYTPNEQFADDAGLPYDGGFLYFYASGTDTPLATYSNAGLTIENDNPIELDSAGRAGNIFLANSAYKVVLKDADDVQIWTADPVYTSDYSTVAQFRVWSGNPNGLVAGTAGTQGGRPSDAIWDPVNLLLYVCTTTGSAAAAVWTAINSPSSNNNVPIPSGYLTLTSGTPVITGDVTAATSVYYTPFLGNTLPVYTGSAFTTQTFSELTLSLTSSQAASTLYDVFVFNNSGVLTLVTGPAWTTSTAGSGARGSGAGTTQISRISGIWVNTVSFTGRNGLTTYSISANQATYLGSLFIDGSAGQVSCYRSFGQNRKWGVWNAYNRMPVFLKAGDATASWSYTTASYRPSNNTANNSLSLFSGLQEEVAYLTFTQQAGTPDNARTYDIGIGVNSTTAISGFRGSMITGTTGGGGTSNLVARYQFLPALGVNTITALELGGTAVTFYGSETNMVLDAEWRA